MIINEHDAVKFVDDPNIYQVFNVDHQEETVSYLDTKSDNILTTQIRNFSDIDTVWSYLIPSHQITGCFFPKKNEIEATWESLETGDAVSITFVTSPEIGHKFAEIIQPCVHLEATLKPT